MSEEQVAPAPEPTGPNQASEIVPTTQDNYSAREAANALGKYRETRDATESPGAVNDRVRESKAAPPTERAVPPVEPAPEQPTVETQPGEAQPTEPPRSWSNEDREWFNALPPETQAILARRENERDTALRRGQNEVAAQRQQFTQQQAHLAGLRQQYEQILPALQLALQQQQQGQFGDIRTMADVEKMAREDWQRYALWDVHQKKVQAVQQEMVQVQQRQQHEYTQRWNDFAKEEDAKFMNMAPEMADQTAAVKIANASVSTLRNVGFSDDDLQKVWSGQANLSARDHRMQLLIMKAAKYDQAVASTPARKVTPVPKVMRPGTPAERATDEQTGLDALSKRLDARDSGMAGIRNAAELLAGRRASRRG